MSWSRIGDIGCNLVNGQCYIRTVIAIRYIKDPRASLTGVAAILLRSSSDFGAIIGDGLLSLLAGIGEEWQSDMLYRLSIFEIKSP